jgi:histidinol-phosphate aminotransferase
MAIEFGERVRRMPTYPVAGGYALPEDIALLASNESPEPPLPQVAEAAARALSATHRYPDPSNIRLRRALAHRYDHPVDRIAVGNGSTDLLLAAGEALLEPGAEIVYAWPSFSVYPHLAAASGATAVTVDLDAEHRHDLEAMAAEITAATRLVIVCNPNNPTSTALPPAQIAEFVARVPSHVAVILDEAYVEYAAALQDPAENLDLLHRHTNLVILRTFSKAYGLAGLRCGYALCGSTDFPQAVNALRQPFYCNVAAQAAGIEALKHQDALDRRVERAIVARVEIESGLADLGIRAAESHANFSWFDLPESADEAEVIQGLADRRVLVRSGTALGRPGALRVSYGTAAENRRFLDALGDLV